MHVDTLATVFGAADRYHVAVLDFAAFFYPETVVVEDERGIHAGVARHSPSPFDLDVSRQIRRREKILWQYPIGRRGNECRVRSICQFWRIEIRVSQYCHALKIYVADCRLTVTDCGPTALLTAD